MNIVDVLSERARQMGEAVAIRDVHQGKDRVITFAELERRSAQAAAFFMAQGLKRGDAVLVLQGMSIELYVALIGIFRAGMIAMFLDPSAGLSHIKRCCALYAPKGLIGSPKAHLLRFASSALRRVPHAFVIGTGWPGTVSLSSSERLEPLSEIASAETETPALLTFTSGSTGQPKAAVRSHGFLLAQHQVLEKSIELRAGEVDLTTLPVFVLANLGSGVTSVIPDADLRRPGFIKPNPVLEQIRRFKPTRTAGSPAFYECLLQHLDEHPTTHDALPSLKVYTGGAPVFPRLLARLKTNFEMNPEAVYGSTEAEPIAHLDYEGITTDDFSAMLNGKGLLAGHPVPEIQLRVLKDQWGTSLGSLDQSHFDLLTTAPEEPGELVVSGEHVLTTYLHGHGNEETKFTVQGTVWHRTGDLGYLDLSGRLWLLGRCVAKITDDRGALFPFAVECVAHQFEWVRIAGCVAVNNQRWLAIQVRQAPTDIQFGELKNALRWAQLDRCEILPTLPVDSRHNAKIDYRQLRHLLADKATD